MRRRRTVAVFAASLLAHAGLFAAWMATRPPERFVEPPAINVTLVTPSHRQAPKPPTRGRSAGATRERAAPAEGPPHLSAAAPPPSAVVAPRVLSEEELLAGRNKDAGQLSAALTQRRHATPWDGCKTMPGPPDWTAPPCPRSGSNEEAKHVLSLPNVEGHGEIARKDRIQAYKDGTGPYPGVSCVIFHKC